MNGANRDFLEGLKKEHKVAASVLEDIKRSTDAGQHLKTAQGLSTLKDALVGHLKKEDDRLYPELAKVAQEKNLELVQTTLRTFTTAMKGISERLLGFFEKYSTQEVITRDASTFQEDLTSVIDSLHKRIDGEERVLYPMYEKHCC